MLSIAGLLIAPGLMWGWLFYRLHRYQRASLRRLAALFVGGMCCGLIALLLNHSVEKYTLFGLEPRKPSSGWTKTGHSTKLGSGC